MNEIGWYPGHMAKALRQAKNSIGSCHVVIEVLDARIPSSSRNPNIADLLDGKLHLLVLNKSDLADPNLTASWQSYFKNCGISSLAINCQSPSSRKKIIDALHKLTRHQIEANQKKGMIKAIKVMVLGIPNSGKSSLINCLAKRKITKTGDRPGVTRAHQWVNLDHNILLLDTPGILWQKLEDKQASERLAITGAIKDTVIDTTALAQQLSLTLATYYPKPFAERYKLTDMDFSEMSGHQLLEVIAQKRGFLISGGQPDIDRAATVLIDEFRGCKIAPITLDPPREIVKS